MTSVTFIADAAPRLSLARDFAEIGEFFRDHPGAIAPEEFRFQIPVPRGLDQPARVAWLEAVAGSWGKRPDEILVRPDGTRYCEIRRGRVTVFASVAPAGHHYLAGRDDDLARRAPFETVLRGAA